MFFDHRLQQFVLRLEIILDVAFAELGLLRNIRIGGRPVAVVVDLILRSADNRQARWLFFWLSSFCFHNLSSIASCRCHGFEPTHIRYGYGYPRFFEIPTGEKFLQTAYGFISFRFFESYHRIINFPAVLIDKMDLFNRLVNDN